MRKFFSALLLVGLLVGCAWSGTPGVDGADLVVYGKIFTSESNEIVEAFAVKDGKYVYVGDRKGAERFVEDGKTEVVDYTDKGLVMPGCGNGHAHYSMGHAIQSVGTIVSREDSVEKFLTEIVPAAVKKARDNGATAIFGMGWNIMTFQKNMPTRQQLDKICSDIPMYFADEEGHKGLVNTIALVNAGIMKEDGTVLKREIRGGEIMMSSDGTPTGYLKEQAGTYVRSFLDNENLFPVATAKANMAKIQEQLLSEGYTMYLDGYSTYFFNDNFYEAAQQMDNDGNLHFVLGTAYELDSWMDVDARLAQAIDAKKFASTRVKPNWMKLFMDGTVETGTGFIEPLYPDGHQGIPNWTEDELTEITRKVNEAGITMHVHVMGNKGVERIVNALINGGKDEMRNTLVHVYRANEADFQRMADHNIYVTEGMLWHHATDELQEELSRILPESMGDKGYPMKSYFDHGVTVSSHSDFPALSGAPDDPFGIMEIAVTGVYHLENAKPWWPEELITREQALEALTINVAKQMFIEDERGSVKEGKYADFLLVDKDVLACPVTEIHEAKPEATYFEGKKVFGSDSAKAPDYSQKASWCSLPEITKDVDTFFIYPTEYMGFGEGSSNYAALDNPEMTEGAKNDLIIQAGVYADSSNVFMPYYRQAGLRYAGEVFKETGSLDAALLSFPYEDITSALDYYFENYNNGRPFILAGHSQGSAIAKLVLKKYFKEHPEYYKRMVAAYVIGYAVTKDDLEAYPHLKFATGESDTGVIISWNTEGRKNVEENVKTAVLLPNAISINPLNWKLDDTYAPASENLGSLVFNGKTNSLEIGDVGADAQVVPERGVIVTNAKVEPMPAELAKVANEFFGSDARHESDYSFYYNNIKANVAKRIAAYKAKQQ